jgi:hypothetical protein
MALCVGSGPLGGSASGPGRRLDFSFLFFLPPGGFGGCARLGCFGALAATIPHFYHLPHFYLLFDNCHIDPTFQWHKIW